MCVWTGRKNGKVMYSRTMKGGSESIICNCGKEGKKEEREDRKQEGGICEKGKK